MPSLPFTFEDVKNLDVSNNNRAAKEGADMVDPANANPRAAQGFLADKINKLKDNMSTSEGLIDVGLSFNPVTRVVDMASKFFGGPGVHKGFVEGTTMTGDVRTPPLRF